MKSFLSIGLLLACFIGMLGTVKAQSFSARAGINIANYVGDFDTDELESRTGFYIGAEMQNRLSDKLFLQIGLNLVQRGTKYKASALGLGLSVEQKNNYLEIPALLRYYTKTPRDGFFIQGGLSNALLLSAKVSDEDVKEAFKSFDVGAKLGVGYEFGEFGVELNFVRGVTSVFEEESTDEDVFDSIISIGVFYVFL